MTCKCKTGGLFVSRYLYAYTLDAQQDLFFSRDGNLNLQSISSALNNKNVEIENDHPIKEGFSEIRNTTLGSTEGIEALCIVEASLGNYFEAIYDGNTFTTIRSKHTYYTKAKIFFISDNKFILMFENSIEERGKGAVNKQIQDLGLSIKSFKITDALIRNLQSNYTWTAAAFNKIVKRGDSTRKVSFDIDPANTTDESLVQNEYSEHGNLSHLKFYLPYVDQGNTQQITVKLYEDKNRIIVDEKQFSSVETFNEFIVYLMRILNENS